MSDSTGAESDSPEEGFPTRASLHATQSEYPWHAVVRTVFQAVVGFAAMWALMVEAMGLDETLPWVAASLAVTGAITRVMAIPAVNQWLAKFAPFLAAAGSTTAVSDDVYQPTDAATVDESATPHIPYLDN